MKTYTTEEVNGLLDELKAEIIVDNDNGTYNMTIFTKEDLDKFKLDKGLTLLEVGKWMKEASGAIAFCQGEGVDTYGLNDEGSWRGNACWFSSWNLTSDTWTLATHQEVETALIKHWEKDNKSFEQYWWHGTDEFNRKGMLIAGRSNRHLFDNGTWFPIDTQLDKLEKKYKELGEEIQTLKNQ